MTTDGAIRYARRGGVCVLRLVGAIRYTSGPSALISRSLDAFLDKLLEGSGLTDVLVDMSDTVAIDSTNLGLVARLATSGRLPAGHPPIIVSPRPDITRTLRSMGFDRHFAIVGQAVDLPEALERIPETSGGEREMLETVLEAHRELMALDASNRRAFSDAVELLEEELDRQTRVSPFSP